MREIKIRDLETGEVLIRHGANAVEILKQDRFAHYGKEPKAWKEKQAAEADPPKAKGKKEPAE